MNDLDRKIQEALRKEDAELFGDFGGEPSMLEMVLETFHGRHRWLVMLNIFWTLVFAAIFVLAAVKFFRAEEMREMMMWAAAGIFSMSAVAMMKTWYFMELNKNAVTREIKRLELQIARLASRIKD